MSHRTLSFLILLPALAGAQVSFGPSQEVSDFIYQPDHVLAHDMDDDGDLDVIAAEGSGAPVRVLWWENDGNGTFGNRREWAWGELDSEVIAITDFNLDGKPDVWIEERPSDTLDQDGMTQRRFLIALADGAGCFHEPTLMIDETVLWTSSETVVCDTNLDGRPDIITPDSHHLATASGSFAPGIPMPESAAYLWLDRGDVTPVDLDDDGDLDLLATSIFNELATQVMWNLGSGAFSDPVAYAPLDQTSSYRQVIPCIDPSGGGGRTLLVLTIFGSNEAISDSLTLFRLTTEGTALLVTSIDLPSADDSTWRSWNGLSCDLESGRNFLGLVTGPNSGGAPVSELFEVVWSGGNLALTPSVSHPGVVAYSPVAVRDLDGDPFPDLLLPIPEPTFTAQAAADQIVWHPGTSDGGFAQEFHRVGQPALDRILEHAGDIDGDGAADILVGGYPPLWIPGGAHELAWYRNNGTGDSFERLPIEVGRKRVAVVGVKDVTSSKPGGGSWPVGRMDLLVQTYDYEEGSQTGILRFEWLLQDESGVFHRTTIASEPATGLVDPNLSDWDGDGTDDLVYSRQLSPSSGPQLVWRRGINEGFQAPEILLGSEETLEGVIDIDWDGDLDLLLLGSLFSADFGGESYWCENDGTGTIVALHRLNRTLDPLGVDLDGDGHEDFTQNGLVIFARPGVTFESPTNLPYAPKLTGLDIDDDGDIDLIQSVPSTGVSGYNALGWWENRGGGSFFVPSSSPPLLPIAGLQWGIRDQQMLADVDADGTPDLVVVSSFTPRIEWFRITRTPAPSAFTDWMAGQGLFGHSAGPLFDLDGDLLSNWDEFAFGGQPTVLDPTHPGMPSIRRNGPILSLSFLRRSDAADIGLNYTVMQSAELLNWSLGPETFELSPTAEGYERISFPLDPNEPRNFFTVAPGGPSSDP